MSEIEEKSGFKIETSALRAYTMLGALVLIWLFFHWQTGGIFLSSLNLSNLMLQTSVTGIKSVIDGLTLEDSGRFFSYDGTEMPW